MTNVALLRTLSICSGIGGLDLGIRLALGGRCRTVGYVEREAFCAAVLVARMEEAALDSAPDRTLLDDAPVWDDLATFDGRPWRGRVDLITGGYPCQPFSLAGSRKGSDDPRHLWPHVRRIVEEVSPPLCFFENVPGHVSLGLEDVVRDLEAMGYRVAATLLSAADVGASHKRERLWIMGHAERARRETPSGGSHFDTGQEPQSRGGDLAHAERSGCDGWSEVPLWSAEQRAAAERLGSVVEHAESERCGQGRTESTVRDGRYAAASCAGGAVADPDLGRRQGVGSGGLPDGGPAFRHDADGCGGRSAGDLEYTARGGEDAAQLRRLEYEPIEAGICLGDPERERTNLRTAASGSRSAARERGVWPPGPADLEAWSIVPEDAQPSIRRVADGLPSELDPALAFRQDRLRALGNAVVPQCAAAAFRILIQQLLVV
jgi:DNA (cytosine-5)-methyltransferase 1